MNDIGVIGGADGETVIMVSGGIEIGRAHV